MKKAISMALGLVGILLLVGAAVLALTSLDAPVSILGQTPRARARTEQWAQSLEQGDYATAAKVMYGVPALEPDRESGYASGVVIWEAYRDSLQCEFAGECYASESGVARDVVITALDISAVMTQVKTEIEPLIARRAEEEDAGKVFDDNGGYQEAFVMDILQETVEKVLEQQNFLTRRTVTLELVYEDGGWWIMPRQEIVDILAGKLGKGA